MNRKLTYIFSAAALVAIAGVAATALLFWLPGGHLREKLEVIDATSSVDGSGQYQNGTFYLEVQQGCYSIDAGASQSIAVSAVGKMKTFFEVDCAQPHHLEVIYTGDITPSMGSTATSDDVGAVCYAAYQQIYGKMPPTKLGETGSYYLAWFFPDPGSEFDKYPNRGVCAVTKPDATGKNYTLINGNVA